MPSVFVYYDEIDGSISPGPARDLKCQSGACFKGRSKYLTFCQSPSTLKHLGRVLQQNGNYNCSSVNLACAANNALVFNTSQIESGVEISLNSS